MQKQILYPSFVSRLFSNVLDFFCIAIIFSHVINFLAQKILFIYCGDFFISNNIDITNKNAVLVAMQSEEFFSLHGASMFYYFVTMVGINVFISGSYFLFFWYKFATTPGKFLLNMKLVDINGNKPNFLRSIKRLLACVTSIVGFWAIPFNSKRQSLHDMISGTIVVKK